MAFALCALALPKSVSAQNAADSSQSVPAALDAAAGIKWHPGHYVWLDPHASAADRIKMIDSLTAEASIRGVQVLANWAQLEGPVAGDYSAGFALVDAVLARLARSKVPKHLILGLNERSFGATFPAGTRCSDVSERLLPRYLTDLPDGGCVLADSGAAGALSITAKFWHADVMDRLIALSQAYAKRYDGHPQFEMFFANGESAVAAPRGSDFSVKAYGDQLKRWFDASDVVWLHTQLRSPLNFFGSDAQMLALMQHLSAKRAVAFGGPDPELPLPAISRTVQANQIFRAQRGSQDFKDIVWVGEVQSMGLGVKFSQQPAEIFAYESSEMHASYMIWPQNNWVGGPDQRWQTGILPFVRATKGAVGAESCPARYGRCDTE